MTSAASPRQPLNGNNGFLLICLALLLAFQGCRASRTASKDPAVVPVILPEDASAETDPAPADTAVPPFEVISMEDSVEQEVRPSYKVAMLLPFDRLDQTIGLIDSTTSFSRPSEISLEFYMGFKLGLEHFERKEVDVRIHVYDTRNSPARTTQILLSGNMRGTDLVIGPVFNKNLRVAADHCREEGPVVISPLSPAASITSGNPYYITANGTMLSHYEKLLDHLREFHPGDTLYMIHHNDAQEREVMNQVADLNRSRADSQSLFLMEVELSGDMEQDSLTDILDSLNTHLVLVPSNDEIFTNYALSLLARIKIKYPSVVYGMPSWMNFTAVNYDYFEWLQVHLTQSYWQDKADDGTRHVNAEYLRKYGISPTPFSMQGYDMAGCMIGLLTANNMPGADKERFFTVEEPIGGIQTQFDFIPRYSREHDGIEYWDNRFIHVLRFQDYDFNKVD